MAFRFLLLAVLISLPVVISNLELEKAALLTFRSTVGRRLSWNTSKFHCSWKGVVCHSDKVTIIRLPASGLIGVIPANVFGNLTNLRTLSLHSNGLSGHLPADLALCTQLQDLYLHNNRFSGGIAPVLPLINLVRVVLSWNNFAGELPTGLNDLKQVSTLYLEKNSFEGSIPELDLPYLKRFNVSYNKLNGSIPKKLRTFGKNSFLGMELCGGPLQRCSGEPVEGPSKGPGGQGGVEKEKKLSGGAIAGIVVGCVVGVLLLVLLLWVICWKKSDKAVSRAPGDSLPVGEGTSRDPKPSEAVRNGSNVRSSARRYSGQISSAERRAVGKELVFFGAKTDKAYNLEDLLRASAEVLGKGMFGTAYKAMLDMGTVVAVKRLKDVNVPEAEFKTKIEAVGAMEHPNLVPLIAYYYTKDEKLLVYEYMPMGSVSALLHGNRGSGRTALDWETRLTILYGAARGIHYIHATNPTASHGNIKSSNVLLAKSYEARMSDQGLAQFASPTPTPNRAMGYRAPEVTDPHQISQKADIYSFGVILLELLTGKAPHGDKGEDLPRWLSSVKQELWGTEVFDLDLLTYHAPHEDMMEMLYLAVECTQQHPDSRPTMSEVVTRIEHVHRGSGSPSPISQITPLSPSFMD